jgi:hypothetical protein
MRSARRRRRSSRGDDRVFSHGCLSGGKHMASVTAPTDVRFWGKADIKECQSDVCF